ncbi:hypothetical protein F5X99DRAFT_371404 [Biscogniauxia marginata]|nr:hypothetical protein F5X99DRAFT_371404 [Biscogniauxia marginata]
MPTTSPVVQSGTIHSRSTYPVARHEIMQVSIFGLSRRRLGGWVVTMNIHLDGPLLYTHARVNTQLRLHTSLDIVTYRQILLIIFYHCCCYIVFPFILFCPTASCALFYSDNALLPPSPPSSYHVSRRHLPAGCPTCHILDNTEEPPPPYAGSAQNPIRTCSTYAGNM